MPVYTEAMSSMLIKRWYILVGALSVMFIYMLWSFQPVHSILNSNNWSQDDSLKSYSQDWLMDTCLNEKVEFSIKNFANIVEKWKSSKNSQCRALYHKLTALYSIERNPAPLKLPETFQAKVRKWLNMDETLYKEVFKQEVTQVYNRWTREHTIFNPLREKRPVSVPEEPENVYVDRMVQKTKESCDFCNFKKFTAEDVFGRLESKYSFSASNAFKLERFHALFALKSHHPHQWNLTQFMDMMELTQNWFGKTQVLAPTFCCPSVIWDILPRAGASQVHPHMHGLVGENRYHGAVENWRQASIEYFDQEHSNYFSDLVRVYTALGLAVHHGDAVALANLVPKKDNEVIVLSFSASKSFFELVYYVMRGFIEDEKKLATSMGIAFPAFQINIPSMPAFARFVTRGPVADVRSDMSSLELFSATNVNIDPFKVIKIVQKSLQNRQQK